jgi:hypothetical protein
MTLSSTLGRGREALHLERAHASHSLMPGSI